ncbi:hypothetical protein PF008_g21672 [Phytophthora fragariae]|uniref:Uncharacterized protein n=1 Tax=Phytophthora fragariae TaxID=53985 RepID=A0A6G0QVX5_9STRA|nr:hypothetical protein PF008_g21672 [Phytophthora fragariae]
MFLMDVVADTTCKPVYSPKPLLGLWEVFGAPEGIEQLDLKVLLPGATTHGTGSDCSFEVMVVKLRRRSVRLLFVLLSATKLNIMVVTNGHTAHVSSARTCSSRTWRSSSYSAHGYSSYRAATQPVLHQGVQAAHGPSQTCAATC